MGHLFPASGTDAVTTGASTRLVTFHPAPSLTTSGGWPGSVSSRHSSPPKKISLLSVAHASTTTHSPTYTKMTGDIGLGGGLEFA